MMSTESRMSAATSAPPSRGSLGNSGNTNSVTNAAVPRDLSASYDPMASRSSPERKRQRFPEASPPDGASVSRSQADRSTDYDEVDQLDEPSKRHKSDSSGSDPRAAGPSGHLAPGRPSPSDRGASTKADVASRYESRDGVSAQPSYHDRRGDTSAEQRMGPRRASSFTLDQQYADLDRRERMHRDAADHAAMSQRMQPPPGMQDTRSPDMTHRLPSMHQQGGSPPPRLPSFASLGSEGQQMRGREETGGYGGAYPTSPRRSMQSSFRPLPYINYPASTSRTPISHHPSPLPSGIYGNPPMIHPSLAGLPGAGGGPGGKQQPSFVSKLYSMLEDPSISDLITWGHTGTVFSVANPTEFSRLVLPNWFKHSNWQSFVRQLNMYGFHKVNHSYQGNPNDEVQVWEFRHPNFRRGEIALLNDIKRKSSRQKRSGSQSGADPRAERSGGSTSPSPEVSMATLPGGPDAARAGMGMQRMPREYMYGDERVSSLGFDRRPDPRVAYEQERPPIHHYNSTGDMSYSRVKAEETASGVAAPSSTMPVGPGYVREDPALRRRTDSFLEREEATARFEDLSERTDAIIRHASFLESQVRMLSEQLNETRAMSRQLVQDDMLQLLDRLERSLSAPATPGIDVGQRMLEVVRSQLAYYSNQYGSHDDRQPESQSQSNLKRTSL